MPSGLASLVLQASAPFTVVLAGVFLRERLTGRQVVGVGVAVPALAVIAVHRSQTAALLPVVLALCGALGWAIGNVATRRAGAAEPAAPDAVVVGRAAGADGRAVARGRGPGPHRRQPRHRVHAEALPADLGLLYIVLVATLVGYGIWSRLLATYPSSTVAPFSMLVPVVGVLASWAAFGEVPDLVEVLAGAVVVAGGAVVVAAGAGPRAAHRGRNPAPIRHRAAPVDGVPVPVLSPGAGDAPR